MFPGFGSLNSTPDKLTECKNMTDETNAQCADSADRGWYKILSDQKKVTAEPTLANNVVYYDEIKTASSCKKINLKKLGYSCKDLENQELEKIHTIK